MSKYQQEASKLINWGYRRISNKHQLLSRIDRADWYRHMAQEHAPWDPNGAGIDWVFSMGSTSAEDHYRRCYGKDKIEVSYEVMKLIPCSNDSKTGYCRKSGEPERHEVCKGDILIIDESSPFTLQHYQYMRTHIKGEFKVGVKALVDAYDVQDKWKIHSINVVTGKSHSTSNKFYDSFDDALDRCKGIVKRDSDVQMVILKCTHVVQAMHPPIEIIDLDQLEHHDA